MNVTAVDKFANLCYPGHGMKDNKTIFYETATLHLVNGLNNNLKLARSERMQAKNLTLLFRDSFKLERVKHATFYCDIGYDYRLFRYDSSGFCRASSFSFVALMNSPDWRLRYIDEIWSDGPHYFVMHEPTQTVFDLTFDQYLYNGIVIPYDMGRSANIDANGPSVIVRFLNAVGLDFNVAVKNLKSHGGYK